MTEEQIQTLIDEYSDAIFRLAYSYLKNRADAEDVMQETLLKRYIETKAFDSPEHERCWLFRVAANECKKILRSPWKRRTGPLDEMEDVPCFDTPAQSELFRQVMALPPKYRAAIYLHYYEGFPVRDIAAAMNANPSTVQTWLMRARGQLQAKLKEAESL
ncbi:MAG: sigma-70 family RNA polymerase sigma factor [Oscillibacter sp.]|nr:sigma-70 family RNA polymerase sigma factor [Oscillibacter sp.]